MLKPGKWCCQRFEFVTFHATPAAKEVHPNQHLHASEYVSMINLMFASAELFHPGLKKTVLTAMNTQLEGLNCSASLLRFDLVSERLMLERTKAQLMHVRASSFERPMVILDSDILINASLAPIFKQDFDVALTWRPSINMPINGGLIVLNNLRPEAAKGFFERFLTMYQEKYANEESAAWFGDQLALRDLVGLHHSQMSKQQIVSVDGCRILLLPCETYNFSPADRYGDICNKFTDKAVLHFKGQRKRLMHPFWEAQLFPRHSYSPRVQWSGYSMRRWLRERALAEALTADSGKED